jgi:hypothetical protein
MNIQITGINITSIHIHNEINVYYKFKLQTDCQAFKQVELVAHIKPEDIALELDALTKKIEAVITV